jgi:alkylation response protein AidB-like acyl-CoA dehydrogenase
MRPVAEKTAMLERVPHEDAETEPAAPGDCIARARQLAPFIAAHSARIEREREIVPEVLDALHNARMFRMLLPRSCDGEEVAPATYVQAIEEIAKADASTAWCLSQGSGSSMSAAYVAPHVARDVFGSPRAVLASGPAGPDARAVVVEGGYRVTGTWGFASGIRHATVLGGHCNVANADGTLRLGADGKPIERTVFAPKASGAVTDNWHVVGLKGTGSNTYTITDLFVPEDHAFSRDAVENCREKGPLYRFSTYQMFGTGFAGIALGIGRASLDAFMTLAGEKTPYRTGRVLRENGVIQSQVALCEAKLTASRALLLQTLQQLWEVAAKGENLTIAHRAKLRLAATYASHQAKDVVDTVYHAAGATAIFESNPFERRFRDIHTVIQQIQGQFSNFELVGQVLLGLPSQTKLI